MSSLLNWLKDSFNQAPGRLVGTLTGFVFAVLIILLGFFETLLIALLTALGFFAGCLIDSGGDLKKCLKRFGRNSDGSG